MTYNRFIQGLKAANIEVDRKNLAELAVSDAAAFPALVEAARANGMTYNRFIQGLKASGVEIDRKNLAELAVNEPAAFTALVEIARANVPAASTASDSETAA